MTPLMQFAGQSTEHDTTAIGQCGEGPQIKTRMLNVSVRSRKLNMDVALSCTMFFSGLAVPKDGPLRVCVSSYSRRAFSVLACLGWDACIPFGP